MAEDKTAPATSTADGSASESFSLENGPLSSSNIEAQLQTQASGAAARLDADLYNTLDIEGGTEGLLGSGNLNFLTLQGQQNDLSAQSILSAVEGGQETPLAGLASAISAKQGIGGLSIDKYGDLSTAYDADVINGIPTSEIANTIRQSESTSAADNNSTTSIAQNDQSFLTETDLVSSEVPLQGRNGADGSGTPGPSGTNGSNGSNGSDGSNGTDGNDGEDGGNGEDGEDGEDDDDQDNETGDNDTDLHIDVDVVGTTLNPVIDVILDPVEAIVGDIDINILQDIDLANGDLSLHIDSIIAGLPLINLDVPVNVPAVAAVMDLVDDIAGSELLENPLQTVTALTENVLTDVESFVGQIPLVQEPLGDIVGDVTDTLNEILDAPVVGALTDTLDGLVNTGDLLQDPVGGALDTVTGTLDNTGATLNTLLDSFGDGMTGEILPGELTDALGTLGDGAQELLNNPLVAGVSDMTGELGDALTQAVNGLDSGADAVTTVAENLTGGVNNLLGNLGGDQAPGLFENLGLEEDATNGDTDLVVDIGLAGPVNANPVLDVLLDPVEAITGDIDVNIGIDADLNEVAAVTETATDIVTGAVGDLLSGQTPTETITDGISDIADDLLGVANGGLLDDLAGGDIGGHVGMIDLYEIEVDSIIETLGTGDLDNLLNGGEDQIWPESPTQDIADSIFDSVLGGDAGGGGLGTPTGDVIGGIGLLDVVNNGSTTSGGGHLGSLFGGLFG